MVCSKRNIIFVVFLMVISLFPLPLSGDDHQVPITRSGKALPTPSGTGEPTVYSPMPGPGKKIPIGSGRYFIYGFDKQPKLGTVIMKVQVYTGGGERETSLEVKADAGMPSMKGAHETGDRAFALSKKGDFLLPVNIVMPGDWEIRLTILQKGKVIFRGRYNFDI